MESAHCLSGFSLNGEYLAGTTGFLPAAQYVFYLYVEESSLSLLGSGIYPMDDHIWRAQQWPWKDI
jgi:hypothetical protein